MKAVLISIQSKWCELIASGKKTVEVRKTKPKNLEIPFKVYIYETLGKRIRYNSYIWEREGKGMVIGEFICDEVCIYGQAIFDEQEPIDTEEIIELLNNSQLTYKELRKYVGSKDFYTLHISDFIIYDKPRELSGFFHYCGDNPKCDGCEAHYFSNTECGKEDYCCSIIEGCKPLKRPPQSWCYVEEKNIF